MQTDVLIVGAGPTGLALACQLTRFGVDFRIVDEKETTTPFSRAIGVQARTLEIYEQIGLADKLVSLGRPAEKVRMMEGGRVRAEVPLKDIGRGMSPYPFLLIVDQGLHEKELYKYLQEHGKDVDWSTRLLSFEQSGSNVTATLSGGETVSARYLVGCDGARSTVRKMPPGRRSISQTGVVIPCGPHHCGRCCVHAS